MPFLLQPSNLPKLPGLHTQRLGSQYTQHLLIYLYIMVNHGCETFLLSKKVKIRSYLTCYPDTVW